GLVERALHRLAVEATERPRALRSGPAVREPDVIGDVVALAVVGLDPLDAEREQSFGGLAPPRLRGEAGEVDRRAGAHPPLGDERLIAVADKMTRCGGRLVAGRRLSVEAFGLRLGRDLAVARVDVDPRRDPDNGPHAVRSEHREHSARVRELVLVELPGVVLRRPR